MGQPCPTHKVTGSGIMVSLVQQDGTVPHLGPPEQLNSTWTKTSTSEILNLLEEEERQFFSALE
jgi:hypothetical protein